MMMMVHTINPMVQIETALEAWNTLPKYGDVMRCVGTYCWLDGDANTIQIYEIDEDKVVEGLKALDKLMLYYRNIPGMKITLRKVMTKDEVHKALTI